MADVSKRSIPEFHRFPGITVVAYVVVISIAVDAALLVGVVAHLDWLYSAFTVLTAVLLAVILLFTALSSPIFKR